VVLAAGAVATALALSAGAAGPARHTGADRYLGLVAPGRRVQFELALEMRDRALARAAQSASPVRAAGGGRASLTAAQIGRRFGLSRPRLEGLRRALGVAGITVRESFPQRTELIVSGAAGSVERMLGVRLGRFADGAGHVYRRPLSTPVIPGALRASVLTVTGLDTKPTPVNAAVPQSGLAAPDLTTLYDIKPLIDAGLDGSGQTIAVFSQDTFLPSDIAAFDRTRHITGAPPVQRVQFAGPVHFYSGPGAEEVDLDIELIRELAPKAQIIDYESPCCGTSTFGPGIDRIVKDGRAKLVNFSYGDCEQHFPSAAALIAADHSFAAARLAGVTVFASSGDQGAYECQRNDLSNHYLTVAWPGSSPNVVSVGGTYVDVRTDGARLDEAGWEDVLTRGGGGGGISAAFPRPSWQTGVRGINNSYTTSPPRRQLPDVAADADPTSGYSVLSQGTEHIIGGTSASSPLFTGSFALISELAARRHVRLGFIAPLLYRAAAADSAAFYDVTLGGNRYFSAGPGWDYPTGLGAPDMARLAADVIAAAAGH
jgi:kumamolisin